MSDLVPQVQEEERAVVPGSFDDVLAQANAAIEQAAPPQGEGYLHPFVGVLQGQSPVVLAGDASAGDIMITVSREEKFIAKAALLLPVDTIGTYGRGKAVNPPPRKWRPNDDIVAAVAAQYDISVEEAKERLGHSVCRSINGISPDPEQYADRVLPDSRILEDNTPSNVGWRDKPEIVAMQPVSAVGTTCAGCQFQQWYRNPEDEEEFSGPPCREYVQAVMYLVAAIGVNAEGEPELLPIERQLVLVEFQGAMGSQVYNRAKKAHRKFQDAAGIASYASVIESGIPSAKVLMAQPEGSDAPDNVLYMILPYVLTASGHLNKYDTMTFVPRFVNGRKLVDAQSHVRTTLAIRDAAITIRQPGKQEAALYTEAVFTLLAQGIIIEGAENEVVLREFLSVFNAYHVVGADDQPKGRALIRTPFVSSTMSGDAALGGEDAVMVIEGTAEELPVDDAAVNALLQQMGTLHTPKPVVEEAPVNGASIPMPAALDADDEDYE